MNIMNAVLALPDDSETLNEIVGDSEHNVKGLSLSSVATEEGIQHFALVVWEEGGTEEHLHTGSMPGRMYRD